MGYARCVAACKVIQYGSNKLGYCDDGNCFKDCLNPLNWFGGGLGKGARAANKPRKLGSCGLNSFTADTPVHALDADGNPVLTPISELQIGDLVLAKSEWKAAGEDLSYEPITDIISTPNAEQKWVHITLKGGDTISATEGHPFNTPEGWRDAILLKKGGQLLLKGEDGDAPTIQIEDIRYETKVLTTYNLEVANAHTFFVGDDAVLVHNGGIPNGYWKRRAPEWMSPYSIHRRYTDEGKLHQVTTYDSCGRRHMQYDLNDPRHPEHQHDFSYSAENPLGVRNPNHNPIE